MKKLGYYNTVCCRGHAMTPDNVYNCPGRRTRACRKCRRLRNGKKHERDAAGRTLACFRGHVRTPQNTLVHARENGRYVQLDCRDCRRIRNGNKSIRLGGLAEAATPVEGGGKP